MFARAPRSCDPGIVNFDSFKRGEIVAVKDQVHGKVLAVGLALEDSDVAKGMAKGYVIDTDPPY